MSDDVTIPRETARERAEALREHAKQCPPMSIMAADLRAAADLLYPPAPPLTLAQEATVERLVADGNERDYATDWVRDGRVVTAGAKAILDFAARDPLRLLAEHGTPLTSPPPPPGTRVLVVPRNGGNPWTANSVMWNWEQLTDCRTVYRLGGAS